MREEKVLGLWFSLPEERKIGRSRVAVAVYVFIYLSIYLGELNNHKYKNTITNHKHSKQGPNLGKIEFPPYVSLIFYTGHASNWSGFFSPQKQLYSIPCGHICRD